MASILKGRALALIILIVASSAFDTISVADARIQTPYNHARQLANDCDNGPEQSELSGCGDSGKGGGGGSPRPGVPSGPTTGSSVCKNGCCGTNIKGGCKCCK